MELRIAANRLTADAQEATERELSSAEQHPAELASETIGLEIDHSVLQHAELELEELEAAVKRVDSGSYGNCEACGKPDQRGPSGGDPDGALLHRGPVEARQERAAQRALSSELRLPGVRLVRRGLNGRPAGSAGSGVPRRGPLPSRGRQRPAVTIGIVLAAAGMDDRSHAGVPKGLEAVRHREEGVRG